MRVLLSLTAAGSVLAATPRIADACSAPACWPGEITPGPASTVPSNLPGVFWRPQSANSGGEASDPTMVVLATADAPETPLPFTATELGDGSFVLVPDEPLTEDTTYTVTDNNACPNTVGTMGPTTSFQVGTQAALPTVLGTLEIASEAVEMIDVATSSGSCSASVLAHRVSVNPNLDVEASPWADVFHFETYVDGQLWQRTESLPTPISLRGTWRLYRTCQADDELAATGLEAGPHTVTMKAMIPGTSTELWSEPLTVALYCPGEEPDDGGDGDGDGNGNADGDDDGDGGCQTADASTPLWLVLGLVGLVLRRRKARAL